MRYSNTTKQFYPDDVSYPASALPADLVEVSTSDFNAAMNRQPGETLDYQNGAIVVIPVPALSLDEVKAAKILELSGACRDAIVAGFQSSALGAVYTYPCNPTDQHNLTASVTASLIPNLASTWATQFWCADVNGNWAFRPHTAAEIQQAGQDGKAHVQAQQASLDTLTQQVNAAATETDVNAIVWG